MNSHSKALKKISNEVKTHIKDKKGIKQEGPYKFSKSSGAKDKELLTKKQSSEPK
jgi:hypothetical protein